MIDLSQANPLEDYEKILKEVGCTNCSNKDGKVLIYRNSAGVQIEGKDGKWWIYFECKNCKHETSLSKALSK